METYKKGGKIDIVIVESEETGISVEFFPITKLDQAKSKAAAMSKYHDTNYAAEIKNVWKADYPHLAIQKEIVVDSIRQAQP